MKRCQKSKKNGEFVEKDGEIDLIIEENCVLHHIEIKKSAGVSADVASSFPVLDKAAEKQRGMGTVVCTCPEPGMLRENVLQLPVWFI